MHLHAFGRCWMTCTGCGEHSLLRWSGYLPSTGCALLGCASAGSVAGQGQGVARCRSVQWLTPSWLQDFTQEVFGVGHRVVHGREISQSVLIT